MRDRTVRGRLGQFAVHAVVLAVFAAVGGAAPAQGTRADYERARALPEVWAKLDRPFRPQWRWLDGGARLWFVDDRGAEPQWVLVAADGTVRRAATREELRLPDGEVTLAPRARWRPSGNSDHATAITFHNRFDRAVRVFWVAGDGELKPYGEVPGGGERRFATFAGHQWVLDFAADDLAGIFVADRADGRAIVDAASRERAMARAVDEPPPAPRAGALFLRDHDVWRRRDGEESRLSRDGAAGDPYHLPAHWSPDGTKALGFQVAPGEERLVHLVESAPKDQLQPKLHTLPYRKPGDRIERPRPRLFDVAAGRQVAIDDAPFADAWSLDHVHWAADGKEVFVLHNQRGHQRLRLFAIDAASGAVRTVIDERNDTFVDYSQKTWLHWLRGDKELLWASERDGWNRVWRVDVATGAARPLYAGAFVLRRVERVDEDAQALWATVLGVHPGQDPYHRHLARIGFDGAVTPLTTADGSHEWEWAPDRRSFLARWSRADQPWVTEWRRADGALLAELARDDDSALRGAGFRPPERFVAKGRDGATDIHGHLILPSTFDPQRRYPVVEDIYAGPHDHHVDKRWGLGHRQRAIAELGFVVVQIDGMGTNWRHKAFHDVAWRNLKDSGFPDRIVWLREAAATRPWLDLSRVGIFGGSAGGQSALAALLHHPEHYHVAVADCGCHDNRMDKIWWNEAWMGWPIGPWYADSSNVTHAASLRGKLLLTVGELDRNVDPASTMQVANALLAADKDFEVVVVPGGGHGVGESPALVRRRQDFFVRHLHGVEPRAR